MCVDKEEWADCARILVFTDCWCRRPRSNSIGNGLQVDVSPRPKSRPAGEGPKLGNDPRPQMFTVRYSGDSYKLTSA